MITFAEDQSPMERVRNVLAEVRRPTLSTAFVALVLATGIVVTQSTHGTEDVGMGVSWYQFYPFYTHRHTDAVTDPLALAVYANLLAVTVLVAPLVRIVEIVLGHELWTDPPTIGLGTAVGLVGLIGFLGVALLGSRSALGVVTSLLIDGLRFQGLYGGLDVSASARSAQAWTPAAAIMVCLCYGAVRVGQRGWRTLRARVVGPASDRRSGTDP